MQTYKDTEFLLGLVDKMTERIPQKRASASEALRDFQKLKKAIESNKLRRRLRFRTETLIPSIFRTVNNLIEENCLRLFLLIRKSACAHPNSID